MQTAQTARSGSVLRREKNAPYGALSSSPVTRVHLIASRVETSRRVTKATNFPQPVEEKEASPVNACQNWPMADAKGPKADDTTSFSRVGWLRRCATVKGPSVKLPGAMPL